MLKVRSVREIQNIINALKYAPSLIRMIFPWFSPSPPPPPPLNLYIIRETIKGKISEPRKMPASEIHPKPWKAKETHDV